MDEYYIEKENQVMSQTGMEFFAFRFASLQKRVRPHIHSAVEILLIVKGRFRVFSESIEHIACAGEAILFRSNTIHRVQPLDEDHLYYVLKLHPSFVLGLSSAEQGASYLLNLALLRDRAKIAWSREECERLGLPSLLGRLIEETEQSGYGSDIALKLLGAEMLLIFLREIEGEERRALPPEENNEHLARRIYDAIVFINQHYAEEITVEDCSRQLFMSYSYFSRKFKQVTGKSFKNYLAATRINHAEKALLSTETPITQIAMECGFNNVAYFSAVYKKLKGIPPSAARENAGK